MKFWCRLFSHDWDWVSTTTYDDIVTHQFECARCRKQREVLV